MRGIVQLIAGSLLALGLAACPGNDDDDDDGGGLPPVEAGTISGTVTAPAGGTISNTEVLACFVVNNQCDINSPNTVGLRLQGTGTSATYTFEDLAAGTYLLAAAKDNNDNGELDPGDYSGVYTGAGTAALAVRVPARNIHIRMTEYTGGATGNGISGTVSAPSGGTVAGTQVVACFVSQGACAPSHANTRQVTLTATGLSGTYSFGTLAAGQYAVLAHKDLNANGQSDTGDYEGFYTTNGGASAAFVTAPAQNIHITLKVKGSGNPTTPSAGVTFLRPADFTSGSATVTLQGLSANERVAVIPVHASQSPSVDGLNFTINTTGVTAQALPSSSMAAKPLAALEPAREPSDSGASEAVQRHQDAHLEQLEKGLRGAEQLRRAGIKPLGAKGTVRAQALDNCPAPYTVGTKACYFWIDSNGTQTRVTATLKHVSTNAYWFVQNEDAGEFTTTELQNLANDFETRVIPPDNRYFGNFADVDNNQKIIIVFSRLLGPQGLLGYVMPADYYDDAEVYPAAGVHSNEGDIFYAATPSTLGGVTRSSYFNVVMPSTMVHELKHLIATGRRILAGNATEELWIEEGSAMAAQQLAGLGSQVDEVQAYARFALAAPQNFRVVHESRPSGQEEGLSIYGYNFLMVWRAAQARGHDAFWKSWVAGPGRGVANLEAHTGRPFSDLMLDWAAALALDHSNLITGYDYDTFSLRDGSWVNLGYKTLQSGVSGTARSMAYFVGRGTGANANITLRVTNGASPHAVVLRLPGALPWAPSGGGTDPTPGTVTVSGTVAAPPGGTLANAVVETCQVVGGACDWSSALNRGGRFSASNTSSSAAWELTMQPSTYGFFASKDVNGDGVLGTGDYSGCFTNGGSGCVSVNVSSSLSGVNITMSVITGLSGPITQVLPPELMKPARLTGARALAPQVLQAR